MEGFNTRRVIRVEYLKSYLKFASHELEVKWVKRVIYGSKKLSSPCKARNNCLYVYLFLDLAPSLSDLVRPEPSKETVHQRVTTTTFGPYEAATLLSSFQQDDTCCSRNPSQSLLFSACAVEVTLSI